MRAANGVQLTHRFCRYVNTWHGGNLIPRNEHSAMSHLLCTLYSLIHIHGSFTLYSQYLCGVYTHYTLAPPSTNASHLLSNVLAAHLVFFHFRRCIRVCVCECAICTAISKVI